MIVDKDGGEGVEGGRERAMEQTENTIQTGVWEGWEGRDNTEEIKVWGRQISQNGRAKSGS